LKEGNFVHLQDSIIDFNREMQPKEGKHTGTKWLWKRQIYITYERKSKHFLI